MITYAQAKYLEDSIRDHVNRYFLPHAIHAFNKLPIHWLALDKAKQVRGRKLVIPLDVPIGSAPVSPWNVSFLGTKLSFWNPIDPPCDEWYIKRSPDRPMWYEHSSGAVMPLWNLAPTLFNLLTLQEETTSNNRDKHGRCTAQMSNRFDCNLIESPIFNDTVAALVELAVNFEKKFDPATPLTESVASPPILVLSHDLDQLRGNDKWTQLIRFFRVFLPIVKLKPPNLKNIWYVIINVMLPKKYYFDNIVGMVEVERMFNYRSSLYFLNGTGGRFGARSGSKLIAEVIKKIPKNWNIGIHYNYDTHLSEKKFNSQIQELIRLAGDHFETGRAHYLRFDSTKSWQFLEKMGIKIDESLGYSDRIGYRAGIAGVFKPYNFEAESAFKILEMPLVVFDNVLLSQYPDDPVKKFRDLISHIHKVGGSISLLFHPGSFFNPEVDEYTGIYFKLLKTAKDFGAISLTSDQLQ